MNRIRHIVCLLTAVMVGVVSSIASAQSTFKSEDLEFFEREVRPILASRCYGCHSDRVTEPKGSFRIDSRDGLLAGGDSGDAYVVDEPLQSPIAQAIRRENGLAMPPEAALPENESTALLRWLELGAPWPTETKLAAGQFDLQFRKKEHWVWRDPVRVDPPAVKNPAWCQNELDRFLLASMERAGIAPTTDTDRYTLARRVALDLIGVTLPRDEVEQFVADRSPDAYERLVDRLLASPRFGEKWARHWLDIMRYAETYGHEFDFGIPEAYRYRDYVVGALNDDLPYDQFVTEHVAGDLLPNPRLDVRTKMNLSRQATAAWWLGQSLHAPVDILGDHALRADDQLDTFSKAFMGMTVSCARCHDHKFDAIATADYYRLLGVFSSSRRDMGWLDPDLAGQKHRAHVSEQIAKTESDFWKSREAELAKLTSTQAEAKPIAQASVTQGAPLWPIGAAEKSVEHPAFVADRLADPALGGTFREQWQQVVAEVEEAQRKWLEWEKQSVLLSDMSDSSDWFEEGLAFQSSVNQPIRGAQAESEAKLVASKSPQFDWFLDSRPRVANSGTVSSTRFGKNLQGAFRSPTVLLPKRLVCYRMRAQGITAVATVDDFYMNIYHQLLFADTRKGVDTGGKWQWVIQGGDLNKYIGHRTYLELLDDGPGWFEVDEVRFADNPPPPKPSSFALEVASQKFDSVAQFHQWCRDRVTAAFERLKDATATEADRMLLAEFPSATDAIGANQSPTPSDQSAEIIRIDAQAPALQRCLATTEGNGRDFPIYVRGNPKKVGEVVHRGGLLALEELQPAVSDGASGRLAVVGQLIDRRNPLTARVMVNRLWVHLFGRGLVDTPDNVGVLGGRPSHPELLDALALDFQTDWSVKRILRRLVTMRAYQQSLHTTPDYQQLDPENRLLGRMSPRRLPAESLRDRLLQLGVGIDFAMGGPGIATHVTDDMQGRGRPGSSGPLDGAGRRSIFLEVRRNFINPLFVAFDYPTPQSPQGKRNQSNVPAQALALLNDPFVLQQTERWIERLQKVSSQSDRIETVYFESIGRRPTDSERQAIEQYLQAEGDSIDSWRDIAHTLINTKEFWFVW